jgi:hypothetical protein
MTLLGRLFLVVALAVVFAGCGGGFGVTPTGPAVKAPVCLMRGTGKGTLGTCRSPDGAWRVTVTNLVGGWWCALYLTRVSSGRRVRMFSRHDAGCDDLTWAKPHLLLFEWNYGLYTLNPATGQVTNPALLSNFVVSPDARWVAGDNANGAPEAPQNPVYVLTVNNSMCVIVPLAPHRTDAVVGFSPTASRSSSAPRRGTGHRTRRRGQLGCGSSDSRHFIPTAAGRNSQADPSRRTVAWASVSESPLSSELLGGPGRPG